MSRYGAHALDQRLDHFVPALLLRERHLQVDLCELRLPVRPQILVAEAAHDLEILLIPTHHQKLLENLRRLRQRVEMARLDTAWNQIVPRALGSGAGHEGRLDLQKAKLVSEVAH